MEKVIKIDGKETRLVANGATPRLYRSLFARDVFGDMSRAVEGDVLVDAEVFENLLYTMAKAGGLEISIDEWLAGMDSPTAIIDVVPEVLSLWLKTNETTVNGKKK